MSEIIKSSLEGIRDFSDVDLSIGKAIRTDSGVTVIPVSKISVGMATGGIDYIGKRTSGNQNFGGAGTTGISVTPLGFLTIDQNAKVELISLEEKRAGSVSKISSILEHSPEIIEKLKSILS